MLMKNNYFHRFKDKYDLRNHFPYELNYELRFKDNLIGNLILIASFLFGTIYLFTYSKLRFDGMLISIIASGTISAILIVFLFLTPLKHLRLHLLETIFLFASNFSFSSLIAIECYRQFKDLNNALVLIGLILSALMALIIFILIMNPRLSKWANLESKTNDDGSSTYIRPKYFVLAYSEWLIIFTYFINLISVFFLVLVK